MEYPVPQSPDWRKTDMCTHMRAERGRCGREVDPQEEVHIQILETERAKELVGKKTRNK